MYRIPLFFMVFCALPLRLAYSQTLFGLPLADTIHVTTGTYTMAVDDENKEKLWFLYFSNPWEAWGGNWHPALVSTEGDTFPLPEWTTSITVGSGFLFTTGNHGPGDPDTARHWLFIWNKQGRLLHQMPMGGTIGSVPYQWRPAGDIIAMCDMHYNPNDHAFDDVEKGGFYFTSFHYAAVCKATIYRDSVWVEHQFTPNAYHHGIVRCFGLVHERSYQGGVWLTSEIDGSPAHSPIYVYPDTVTGGPEQELEVARPRIGLIYSLAGNMEEGLWALGGWPPDDNYRCTAYLFRNPVSVDITFSQVQPLVPSLYPNPTNSWFVLSGLPNRQHDVVVYNLLGQAVYQVRVNGTTAHVAAPWPTGLYFVQVDNLPALKLQLLR